MTDFLNHLARFLGEIARPLAIIVTSIAGAWATVVIAGKVENGNDGAIFAGAYFLGIGTLFLGKAAEVISAGRHRRDVDVAQATSTSTTPQPVEVVNDPTHPVPVEPT